jgi:hypothetical protein
MLIMDVGASLRERSTIITRWQSRECDFDHQASNGKSAWRGAKRSLGDFSELMLNKLLPRSLLYMSILFGHIYLQTANALGAAFESSLITPAGIRTRPKSLNASESTFVLSQKNIACSETWVWDHAFRYGHERSSRSLQGVIG